MTDERIDSCPEELLETLSLAEVSYIEARRQTPIPRYEETIDTAAPTTPIAVPRSGETLVCSSEACCRTIRFGWHASVCPNRTLVFAPSWRGEEDAS